MWDTVNLQTSLKRKKRGLVGNAQDNGVGVGRRSGVEAFTHRVNGLGELGAERQVTTEDHVVVERVVVIAGSSCPQRNHACGNRQGDL